MNDQFIRSVSFDWNQIDEKSYLRDITAINGIDRIEFHSAITFFVGENGSGKSTLLEAIAVAYGFNPEGGTRNYSFSTYDSHSELWNAIRLTKGIRKAKSGYFLRAESFYNVATKEEEYADSMHPSKRYHEKSHGESFLAIAQNYLNAGGIYIFDEPEAALSPQRQLTLLLDIYKCAKEGAQFIIATHSPILLGIPDAEIYSFDQGEIHLCEYEETESFQVTEMFVNNRKALLQRLLSDGE
ncbi:MAG: AAA family ATPase [Lachnospiraceae bacterium]|jgi:Predicted ATPase|nr:AAA family ATPase [Lachnospiraceae bacterium]